jgi:hypothetical protein
MATPPDFTAGAVLTAAQMNAVGLWLVATQTVGTGVSSVTVTDAFSSDYDSYRVVINGGSFGADSDVGIRLGASATQYYGVYYYSPYAGSGITTLNDNNTSSFVRAGAGYNLSGMGVSFDLHNPNLAKFTIINVGGSLGSTNGAFYGGVHKQNTAYTDLTVLFSSACTGGTISVYGYRK